MARRSSTRRLRSSAIGFAAALGIAAGAAGGTVWPRPDAVQPLQPGAQVPSAAVEDASGARVDLAQRVREQGALLVFYRGGW